MLLVLLLGGLTCSPGEVLQVLPRRSEIQLHICIAVLPATIFTQVIDLVSDSLVEPSMASWMARVVHEFSGENEHELSLCMDEVVEVVDEEACGWWYGRIKSADESGPAKRHGWFPASYVKPLAPMPTRAPPR